MSTLYTGLSIGQQVRARRAALGFTQAELAAAATVSRKTLSAIENGTHRAYNAGSAQLQRVAAALGCELYMELRVKE